MNKSPASRSADPLAEPPDRPSGAARRRSWVPLALYSLAVALLLSPVLFTNRVPVPGDLLLNQIPWLGSEAREPVHNPAISDVLEQFYSYYHYLRSELRQGRFPLWNPYVLNGTPFLANSVSAPLSPVHTLLLPLPFHRYFEWSGFLKLLIAGLGIYFFCRRIGLPEGCAAAGGAFYLFCGYSLYFLLYPNTAVAMLLGWGLLALEDYLATGSRRSLGLLGVVVGLAYLGGHVESALLLHLALGLYTLLRDWRRIVPVGMITTLGFLSAAVVLFPFIEYLFDSATLSQRAPDGRNPYFLSWRHWPGLLIPYFVGSPVDRSHLPPTGLFEGSIYWGIVPAFFAMFCFRFRGWTGPLLPLLAVFVWSAAILFGVPPIFDLFTAPPLLREGNHFHIVQLLHGSGAILAAMGLFAVSRSQVSRRLQLIGFGVVSALWFGAALLQTSPAWSADAAGGSYFFLTWRLTWPAYPFWAALTLLAACLWGQRPFGGWVITCLVLLNGIIVGSGFHPAVDPARTLDQPTPVLEWLRQHPHERILATGIGAFAPNIGMRWGVRDTRGYESLVFNRIPNFYALLTGGRFEPHQFVESLDAHSLKWLRRLGCRFILSPVPLPLEELTILSSTFPYLYEVSGASRLTAAQRIRPVASSEEALRHLIEYDDPRHVVLEIEDVIEVPAAGVETEFIQDHSDHVEIRVVSEQPFWLVLRDTNAPGWRASVDGRETEIVRADYLFRAVWVPAGDRLVRFEYRPRSFQVGLTVSILAVAFLLLLALSDRRRA